MVVVGVVVVVVVAVEAVVVVVGVVVVLVVVVVGGARNQHESWDSLSCGKQETCAGPVTNTTKETIPRQNSDSSPMNFEFLSLVS